MKAGNPPWVASETTNSKFKRRSTTRSRKASSRRLSRDPKCRVTTNRKRTAPTKKKKKTCIMFPLKIIIKTKRLHNFLLRIMNMSFLISIMSFLISMFPLRQTCILLLRCNRLALNMGYRIWVIR